MIAEKTDLAKSENWKPIPGFEDYSVSSVGRVMRVVDGKSNAAKAGKILSPTYGGQSKGYDRVTLYRGDLPHYLSVHRLVLMAFVGSPPSEKHMGAHNDGNTRNNVPDNLRWALPKENSADMKQHGTHRAGVRHANSKISPVQLDAIRKISALGTVPSGWLAEAVGLGKSTMLRIINGETYK